MTTTLRELWGRGQKSLTKMTILIIALPIFGSDLMLPAAGERYSHNGALAGRGGYGRYWSSSQNDRRFWWTLDFEPSIGFDTIIEADTKSHFGRDGYSLRCVAE